MKTTYPADRSVSIWVGTFETEDAFDRAMDREMEAVLKLPTTLAAIAEGKTARGQAVFLWGSTGTATSRLALSNIET